MNEAERLPQRDGIRLLLEAIELEWSDTLIEHHRQPFSKGGTIMDQVNARNSYPYHYHFHPC
jgi:hypothetical protein